MILLFVPAHPMISLVRMRAAFGIAPTELLRPTYDSGQGQSYCRRRRRQLTTVARDRLAATGRGGHLAPTSVFFMLAAGDNPESPALRLGEKYFSTGFDELLAAPSCRGG